MVISLFLASSVLGSVILRTPLSKEASTLSDCTLTGSLKESGTETFPALLASKLICGHGAPPFSHRLYANVFGNAVLSPQASFLIAIRNPFGTKAVEIVLKEKMTYHPTLKYAAILAPQKQEIRALVGVMELPIITISYIFMLGIGSCESLNIAFSNRQVIFQTEKN